MFSLEPLPEAPREKPAIANKRVRTLFIFSPMYVARSLLPNPLRLLIQPVKEDNIESDMLLEGRELLSTLETYESADTKYHLRFIVSKDLPPSEPVMLSWGIIEQVRNKNYHCQSIDTILKELHDTNQPSNAKWPFMDDVTIDANEYNDQPKTDVQVTFTQLHPLVMVLSFNIFHFHSNICNHFYYSFCRRILYVPKSILGA